MKKTKLWKRIAGWLLVFLLVLQLPVNAFAGEWVDNTPYSSEENFTEKQDVTEESDSSGDQTGVENRQIHKIRLISRKRFRRKIRLT